MAVEFESSSVPKELGDAAASLSDLIRNDIQLLREKCDWPNRKECWRNAAKQHPKFARDFKPFSTILTAFKDAASTSVPRYDGLLNNAIGTSLSRAFGLGIPLHRSVQDILGIIVWNRSGRPSPDKFDINAFEMQSEWIAQELDVDIDGNIDPDFSEKLTAKDVLGAVLQGKLKISQTPNS